MRCNYRCNMWCNCKKPAKPYPSTPSISAPDVDSLDLGLNTQGDVTFTYTPADVQINVGISSSDMNVAQTYPLVFGDGNARFTVVGVGVGDATITITNNDNPEQTYTVSITVTDVTPPYYTNNNILVNVETPGEATPTRKGRSKAKVEATGDIYRAKVFAADWDSPDYVGLTWGEGDTPAVSYLGDADNEYCRALFASVDVINSIARSVEDIHNAGLLENGVAKFENESWEALQTFFADPLTEESVEAVDEVIESNPPARFSAPKWNTDLSPSSVQKFDHVSLFLMMPENGGTISAEPYGGITIQSQYQHEGEGYNYIVYGFITGAGTVSLRCTSSDGFVDDLIIESADAVSVEALNTLPASISVEVGETTEIYFGYTPSNAENVENQIILTSFNCSAVITAASGGVATLSVTGLEAGNGSVTLVVYGGETYYISVSVTQPAPQIYLSNEVTVYGLSVEEVEGTNYYSYAIELFSRGDPYTDGEFIYVQVSGASEDEYLSGVASFEVSPAFPSQEGAITIEQQLEGLTVKQFYDIFLSDLGTSVEAMCQGNMYHDMVLSADKVYKNPSDTAPFDTQLTAYLNARECAVQYPEWSTEWLYVHFMGDTNTIEMPVIMGEPISTADILSQMGLQIGINEMEGLDFTNVYGISESVDGAVVDNIIARPEGEELWVQGKYLNAWNDSSTRAPSGAYVTYEPDAETGGVKLHLPQDDEYTWKIEIVLKNTATNTQIDWFSYLVHGWWIINNGQIQTTETVVTPDGDQGDTSPMDDMLSEFYHRIAESMGTQLPAKDIWDAYQLETAALTTYITPYDLDVWMRGFGGSYLNTRAATLFNFLRMEVASGVIHKFKKGRGKNRFYGGEKMWAANADWQFEDDGNGGYNMWLGSSGTHYPVTLSGNLVTYLPTKMADSSREMRFMPSMLDNIAVQFYSIQGQGRDREFLDFYDVRAFDGSQIGALRGFNASFDGTSYFFFAFDDGEGGVRMRMDATGADGVIDWIDTCVTNISLATYQSATDEELATMLRNALNNYVPNPVQTIGNPSESSVEIIMGETNPQITFSYTPTDANEFDNISVVSDDEGVATVSNVNNNGNGTASFTIEQVGVGTCTVTYSLTSDPTQTYDIDVTVTALTPATLTSVDTTPLTIVNEEFAIVQFTYTPTDANDFSGITVTSTDDSIVSGEVNTEESSEGNGEITLFGENEGSATITVSDGTNTYQIPVTSQWTHVSTIGQPSQNSITLTEGDEDTSISFSYSPSDAYQIDSDINVSSSDDNVATVEIDVDESTSGNGVLKINAIAPGTATLTYELADDPTQTYSISVTVTAALTPVETTSYPSANTLSITPGTYSDVYMSYTPTNCTVQDMNDTITISNPTGFSSEYVWNAGDGSVSTFRITAADDGSLHAGGLTYQATQDQYAKAIYVESGPSEPLVSLTAPSTTHYTVTSGVWTSFDFSVNPSNAFPAASELTITYDKCYASFATRDTSTGAITVGYTPSGIPGESGYVTISMTNDPTQTFTVTFDIA